MRHRRIIVTHYGGSEALQTIEEECPEPAYIPENFFATHQPHFVFPYSHGLLQSGEDNNGS
ncbi:MAG TPA: hypothetical protein VFX10_00705, partial [Nitrospira sp.]|nr:hypothetical protein [Nitrospira sp.]